MSRPTTGHGPTRCCRSSASWRPTTTGTSRSLWSSTRSSTPMPTDDELDARVRRGGRPASTCMAADGATPIDEPLVRRPEHDEVPAGRVVDGCRTCTRPRRGGGQGAHPRGRHLPGRARPALRRRPRRRPARRLPRAASDQPEPVHVLRAGGRADPGRVLARADGAAARRHGSSPARSRAPGSGDGPTSTTASSRPSCRSTPRSGPSTSCWSTWPATTSAGSSTTGRAPSTS